MAHTKKTRFEPRTPKSQETATYSLPHSMSLYTYIEIGMYQYARIDAWDNLIKKRKQHRPPGDDASTGEAAPGRIGSDEQGEARRGNTTPNGGPHLDRGRLLLKTWSKSDFSIAETTWPT